MRFNIQQVRRSVIGYGSACAAMLVPAALLVLSPGARAQTVDDAPAAPVAVASVANAAPDVVPATPAALVPATLEVSTPAGGAPSTDTDSTSAAAASGHAPADPVAFGNDGGNDGAFAGIGSLDDQTLSRQRGGAVGMVMVAATPQLMRGSNNVTLWDEIAPPAPLPIPVDATQNAQGNVASYTRK
ncbi:hypothetical protein E1N52_15670 [Paraburkholderia guartelaensis]|uniref:Uncharacterized protein n=1 Tax=Paraburkholderia guartelaensis TaxID=2546446 RepID=A0A4R5LEQ3_9BURK|nr:hypothetical protein [Paraburkholderia guartelaensis]TDG07633.1 hypothetical protein E1N52_15670 [Paraburkholderia guartelaensis]